MKFSALLTSLALGLAASTGCAQVILKIEHQSVQLDGYFYQASVASDGKAPVILALHGCGGMLNRDGRPNLRTLAYARLITEQGWHVLFLDSFSPRGVKSVCGDTRVVGQATRVSDVQAAVAFLAGRPEVDAKRIGILGWSHGATTTLLANNGSDVPHVQPVVAFASFYPACGAAALGRQWAPAKQLLMQLGALDDWTDPQPCEDLASRFPTMIRLNTYANAYHGFDADEPLRQRQDIISRKTGMPVHVGGEPAAKAASQAALVAFFKDQFK